MQRRAMVIAPHPDDEILGVGGTIARLVQEDWRVTVAIVTKARESMFPAELIRRGREEARASHDYLAVAETFFCDDMPAALLDTVPHSHLNERMAALIQRERPEWLFIPFVGDIHMDHQLVFQSALVACRPNGGFVPRRIYAYETLSETNWNAAYLTPGFIPNVFVNIEGFLETKIAAMKLYESQLRTFPNERSIEAIQALAMLRGSTVGVRAAEGFVLVREVIDNSGS